MGKKEDLTADRNQARLKEVVERKAERGDPWNALREGTKEHPMAGRTPQAKEIVQRMVERKRVRSWCQAKRRSCCEGRKKKK